MKRVKQEGIPCSGGGDSSGGDGDDETGDGGGGGFSLIGTLGDPVEIRGWQNCALPTDKVTAERQRERVQALCRVSVGLVHAFVKPPLAPAVFMVLPTTQEEQ